MCWLPTGCALTARQRPKSACRLATSGACARTIGPRIRINRLDDASARCSVSKRPDQPNDSCLFTPPSKTRSTANAISHPAARSASSETKRSGRGEPPPRPEAQLRLPIFTRPNLGSRDSAATSIDSAALELICLDYLGGQTLQERLAVLGPQALAAALTEGARGHCHINRFYCSVLIPSQEPVSIKSMG
jgi:hypothetical protein